MVDDTNLPANEPRKVILSQTWKEVGDHLHLPHPALEGIRLRAHHSVGEVFRAEVHVRFRHAASTRTPEKILIAHVS